MSCIPPLLLEVTCKRMHYNSHSSKVETVMGLLRFLLVVASTKTKKNTRLHVTHLSQLVNFLSQIGGVFRYFFLFALQSAPALIFFFRNRQNLKQAQTHLSSQTVTTTVQTTIHQEQSKARRLSEYSTN